MIEDFIKKYQYQKKANLKKYNTYKIESLANYLIFPKDSQELLDLLKYLKKNNLKYIILGAGSNIILAKNNYDIVIKLDNLNHISINNDTIVVEAGYSLMKLAREVATLGLSGLEFAGGIPGQVGASVAMNAGAYKQDMSSIVESVKIIDDNFQIKTLTKDELNFSYRSSLFKEKREYICLEATLKLQKDDKNKIFSLMENRAKRRMETQPLNMPSAGSVFRNPNELFAGALIEDLGLKGYNINDACVSEKHANFIINKGNATGEDIINLITYIQSKVKEKYNIDLILEQEIKR